MKILRNGFCCVLLIAILSSLLLISPVYSWAKEAAVVGDEVNYGAGQKALAGREFFRAIPIIYSPPVYYVETWLDRSVAIWCQEKFTEEINYVPPEFIGNEMVPFYTGLLPVGPRSDYEKGMSP